MAFKTCDELFTSPGLNQVMLGQQEAKGFGGH